MRRRARTVLKSALTDSAVEARDRITRPDVVPLTPSSELKAAYKATASTASTMSAPSETDAVERSLSQDASP
jgi:hypothetical protein